MGIYPQAFLDGGCAQGIEQDFAGQSLAKGAVPPLGRMSLLGIKCLGFVAGKIQIMPIRRIGCFFRRQSAGEPDTLPFQPVDQAGTGFAKAVQSGV